jgi:hypothetical protein
MEDNLPRYRIETDTKQAKVESEQENKGYIACKSFGRPSSAQAVIGNVEIIVCEPNTIC